MSKAETIVGAPMPSQYAMSFADVPVPFHIEPQAGDAVAQTFLGERIAIKILSRAQQALKQKRGLDDIAAVVLPTEGYGRAAGAAAAVARHSGSGRATGAGSAIHEVRKMTVITGRAFQEIEHERKTRQSFIPSEPSPFRRGDDGHDAKAGTSDRDAIILWLFKEADVIARKAARGMRALPKIEERLALHEIKKRRIR